MSRTGVWLIGAAGNVGVAATAGWAAVRAGLLPPVGLVTMAPPLDLGPLPEVVFGGHEVRALRPMETARALVDEGILPARVIAADAVHDALDAVDIVQGLTGDGGRDDLARVRADLAAFRDRHRLERVIVVNVASTEAPLREAPPGTPEALWAAVDGGLRLPASVLYAMAALDLGFGYVNFTPSPGSDLPALHALAETRGAVHAGADGKTGETLIKTALAPLFAIRQLRVQSWIGHNVLGNEDGRALDDPARRASKQASKAAALASILGYQPESHVAIDYVPSYGDWKVAWDRIVFEGFGGASMSLELSWRGSDTALAAPLVIDLVRLVEAAQRRGERGVLPYLAVFFKRPLGSSEHRLERQWQALLTHLGI